MQPILLIRGGGDLASGVVLRLHRAGFKVVVSEIERPLAVRRLVSFAEAIYSSEIQIEEVVGRHVKTLQAALDSLNCGIIPVLVDPGADIRHQVPTMAVVDGRMTKKTPEFGMEFAPMSIGLGPGFVVGENCHAIIETKRGPFLGRVYWQGKAEADTGMPETVGAFQMERVLRAPAEGIFIGHKKIGESARKGEILAEVAGLPLTAPFEGILRGLLHDGLPLKKDIKVGDLDPRNDPRLVCMVSDKALAVGGGVLEALLSRPEIRSILWR
jgi:xanthine dehydrogenase accessory factor